MVVSFLVNTIIIQTKSFFIKFETFSEFFTKNLETESILKTPKDLHKPIKWAYNFTFLCVLFIKPGKSELTDQIFQHLTWSSGHTEGLSQIILLYAMTWTIS